MADPIIEVAPPRRTPRVDGLLALADVRDEPRLLAANGVQYIAEPCNFEFGEAGFCYGDLADPDDKTYTGLSTLDGVVPNFAAYYGVQCLIDPRSDYEERARAAFELAESRHVEEVFATWLATATPTAATSLLEAIAEADNHADNNYIARPVLHLNRGDVVRAKAAGAVDALDAKEGLVYTPNGTPVVSSGRYAEGSVAITGSVTILRSPLVVNEAQEWTKNTREAVAERGYGIIVDCNYVVRYNVA